MTITPVLPIACADVPAAVAPRAVGGGGAVGGVPPSACADVSGGVAPSVEDGGAVGGVALSAGGGGGGGLAAALYKAGQSWKNVVGPPLDVGGGGGGGSIVDCAWAFACATCCCATTFDAPAGWIAGSAGGGLDAGTCCVKSNLKTDADADADCPLSSTSLQMSRKIT